MNAIGLVDGIVVVRCSGEFGEGTASAESGHRIKEAIVGWMAEHPDVPVTEVEVDLRDVEYVWGDGPVSGLIMLVNRGIARIRLRASAGNREALQKLVQASGGATFFTVSGDEP